MLRQGSITEVMTLSEPTFDPDKLELDEPIQAVLYRWLGLPVPEETGEDEEGIAPKS
jgi:hypothetical protein